MHNGSGKDIMGDSYAFKNVMDEYLQCSTLS